MESFQDDLDYLDAGLSDSELDPDFNPFFVQTYGSDHKYTKTKTLAEECQNLYILCLSDDLEMTDRNKNRINLFYDPEVDIEELNGQADLVTILKAPFFLINIPAIRSGLVKIENTHLEKFNHESGDLCGKYSYVFMMLESAEADVANWLSSYTKINNLDIFIKQKIFTSYHDLTDSTIEQNLINRIMDVADFAYWENPLNCKLSINKAFGQRRMNLRIKWKLPVDEIEKIVAELEKEHFNPESQPKINPQRATANTYPDGIIKPEKPKQNYYVDASRPDKPNYFMVSRPNDQIIRLESVTELLKSQSLSLKEKYYLTANLLRSKNYAHYVLNNPLVLTCLAEIFEQFKPIFKYLMSYAFITLYKEESVVKTRTTTSDRHVFNIETASKLPTYPFIMEDPHANPYFTLLVSKTNLAKNIGGIKQSFMYQNGIVDLVEFRRRLNIFMSGKSDVDILAGVNWTHMAVTGGCMAGIMPKSNPLMAYFRSDLKNTTLTDSELDNFFSEYYGGSDIDVACNHPNLFDFIESVKQIKEVVCRNLNIKDSEVDISPMKTVTIHINIYILKIKCETGEIPFTYDHIISNKNSPGVKHYFYEIYIKQKMKSNQKNIQILGNKINESVYCTLTEYVQLDDITILFSDNIDERTFGRKSEEHVSQSGIQTYYALDKQMSDISLEEKTSDAFIKMVDTIKYKISSVHLKHTFEIFRIDFPEFFSTISRFHFPCVRAYYDGTTCWMTTSAVTAYMTLSNIEYKFLSGRQDPISIIHKYRRR